MFRKQICALTIMDNNKKTGKLFKYGILVQIPGAILFVFSNSTLAYTLIGFNIFLSFCLFEWAALIFLNENSGGNKVRISIPYITKFLFYTWSAFIMSLTLSPISIFFKFIYEKTT